MDPVLRSTITTVMTYALGAAGAWAVAKGYLTKDEASSLTPDLIGAGTILIGGLLAWYKASQHTQKALIAAVNGADNGVKVVAEKDAPTAPLAREPFK